MSFYIYGIREHGSKEARYIGQTNDVPEIRLAGHIKTAKRNPCGCNPQFRDWLLNSKVETFKIAKVETRSEALATEKVIVALCLTLGHRLFNRRPLICAELQAAA